MNNSEAGGARKDSMSEKQQEKSGAKPRRNYDENYKRHAVDLTMRGGRSVKAIATELGLPAWALYEWRRHYVPKPGGGVKPMPQTLEEAEQTIVELRAQVVRLQERETVLKKSLGILSEPPESGMPRSKR